MYALFALFILVNVAASVSVADGLVMKFLSFSGVLVDTQGYRAVDYFKLFFPGSLFIFMTAVQHTPDCKALPCQDNGWIQA